MGICNVLAIIPFLCSAPAEEPAPDEEVIEAQPAPEVEMTTLTAPGETEPAAMVSQSVDEMIEPNAAPEPVQDYPEYPEFMAAPAEPIRSVSDYEVLPPTADASGNVPAQPADPQNPGMGAGSFGEWVSQNWGDDDEE